MFRPTARSINMISLIVSIIIFTLFYSIKFNNQKMRFNVSFTSQEYGSVIENTKKEEKNEASEVASVEKKVEKKENSYSNWLIKIPEINLIADISQGTSKEVMDKYVGHFEETSIEYGNIGLAAHNRGYPVNYFQDLKKLKIGSEIIYKHEDFEMTYEIETIEIIENTNWEYLKNTEDNRITLITCVENEPKYRRCIQGIEKIESEEF